METIIIKRVPYGKTETLPNEREYRLTDKDLSPVGNIAEWTAWATDLIIPKKLRVIDDLMGEDYEIDL